MKALSLFKKNMFAVGTILYLIMLVAIGIFWHELLTSTVWVHLICIFSTVIVMLILFTGSVFGSDFNKMKDNWFRLAWAAGSGLFCAYESRWGEPWIREYMRNGSIVFFILSLMILILILKLLKINKQTNGEGDLNDE